MRQHDHGPEESTDPDAPGRDATREAELAYRRALDSGLRSLTAREHSRAELRRKLGPHVEEGVDLEALLDDFTKRGWLSEERFVEQTVRAKSRKFGPLGIAHHLRERGSDEARIEQGRQLLRKQADLQSRAPARQMRCERPARRWRRPA